MKRLGSDEKVYSEDEVRKHVGTISQAIMYMHAKHCVHRDLKPENVLLSDPSPNAEVRLHNLENSSTLRSSSRTLMCSVESLCADQDSGSWALTLLR